MVTLGHGSHTTAYFDRSTDVVLLKIGDAECYDPELIREQVRKDRLPGFVAIGCLLSMAGYWTRAYFRRAS